MRCVIVFFFSLFLVACAQTHQAVTAKSAVPVDVSARPFALVNALPEGALKNTLSQCANNPDMRYVKSDFSIGHRGAPLQFPEHTKESYLVAARMGAGTLECDVTFTRDGELVCRHSQCDLHTTTNILQTPLAQKCSVPFTPATQHKNAQAKCCTSDITLAEFKTLKGKMDGANPRATTVEQYMQGTPSWRTNLYQQHGTLMTHKQSIALFKALGVNMAPELKAPQVAMPFNGMSQHDYAQKMLNEYRLAQVSAKQVWPQSFNLDDVLYWIDQHPEFAQQAVYLDGRDADPQFDHQNSNTWSPSMAQLKAQGVQVIAPPIWMLLTLDEHKNIVPSGYALAAKEAGLHIIAWSLERSGTLTDGGGWYYQSVSEAIHSDADTLRVLDILARDVGVLAVFSDWPGTTTFYANCMALNPAP